LVDHDRVQGRSFPDRELLDAQVLAGHMMPAGSVYAFLAQHRCEVFPDGMFADLFPSGRGRPSVPGSVIASVLVLQTLQGLSDREAMEALRWDLRWKIACGLSVDHEGLHPTTLTLWRGRLRTSDRPQRIFDAVREVVTATGVLTGKTRRALDSVVLDDAVATQDTVRQLVAAVRRVRRGVPGAAAFVAEHCHAHDWDDVAKPRIDWDDEAARDGLVSALVGDALAILAAFADATADERAGQALALLALIAGQDVEPAEGSDGTDGRWRIARRVAPDRVISTVDAEARHVHKTVHSRQDGFKGHVAVEPETGLFTAVALAKATGEDNHEAVIGLELLADEPAGTEVLGDAAYGTGELRAALADAEHVAVLKPPPLRPAVPGGLNIDDFIVDEPNGQVTCPGGHTRRITAKRSVTFGVVCRGCPLRQRCTTSKTGRSLQLHPQDAILRAARAAWATDTRLRDTYQQYRPMLERSIAWLVGVRRRCRRLPYRGVAANN
jgi:transposase